MIFGSRNNVLWSLALGFSGCLGGSKWQFLGGFGARECDEIKQRGFSVTSASGGFGYRPWQVVPWGGGGLLVGSGGCSVVRGDGGVLLRIGLGVWVWTWPSLGWAWPVFFWSVFPYSDSLGPLRSGSSMRILRYTRSSQWIQILFCTIGFP